MPFEGVAHVHLVEGMPGLHRIGLHLPEGGTLILL